jgi:hypothetical protein
MTSKNRLTVVATSAVVLMAMASTASAEEIHRSNWVPNVGFLIADTNGLEQALGDMWTFNCPPNVVVIVSVDTKDDTDENAADIDPLMFVLDGTGHLIAFADDNRDCTYPPICGFACPRVEVSCGTGRRHSIIVEDFGAAGSPNCQEGGGYELTVEVFNGSGEQLSSSAVNLGGGPRRTVPEWALADGTAPVGPVLDDENVPFPFNGGDVPVVRSRLTPSGPSRRASCTAQDVLLSFYLIA